MNPFVWLVLGFWSTGGGSTPEYVVVAGPLSSAVCEARMDDVMTKGTPPGQSVTATCAEARSFVDSYVGKYRCSLSGQKQLEAGSPGFQAVKEWDYSCPTANIR